MTLISLDLDPYLPVKSIYAFIMAISKAPQTVWQTKLMVPLMSFPLKYPLTALPI